MLVYAFPGFGQETLRHLPDWLFFPDELLNTRREKEHERREEEEEKEKDEKGQEERGEEGHVGCQGKQSTKV